MLQVGERADVMISRPEWVGQCDQSTGGKEHTAICWRAMWKQDHKESWPTQEIHT